MANPYLAAIPRAPNLQPAGPNIPYSFQVGMQIGDAVRNRRNQRKLQKLLSKREPFERDDFMQMASINPLVAKEVMEIDREFKAATDEDRSRALSRLNDTVNLTADIAYRMTQVPPEARGQVLDTFLGPMSQNPATKGLGRTILRQFMSDDRRPGSGMPGPRQPDFSDERLKTILGVASGLDTYLSSQEAQRAREDNMIKAGKMPPSVLKSYKDMGYSEAEAAALWDSEHGVRTVETAEGDQSLVGISGQPLFTGSGGPQLPPGGGDVQMVSPDMFTAGGGQTPGVETAGTPPQGGGGWLDRLGNKLTPTPQTMA